ncbi:DUF7266 family protein [Halorarius halobius]|uniref:DUF7266 family protein n=1 Tax=Halorarius halobius TaxID=2962671 RepID=UPI0020CDD1FD|nr:hypothetical protein [Halorarius halobius]
MAERDRGVTSVLNYALLLVVVTLLIAGLFVGVSDLVAGQHERTTRSQLETVGHRLAADVGTADRLVAGAGGQQVRLHSDLPDAVGGSQYRVSVTGVGGDRYELTLQSDAPDVAVSVRVRSGVGLRETTVDGGRVVVEYDPTQDELVVTDD